MEPPGLPPSSRAGPPPGTASGQSRSAAALPPPSPTHPSRREPPPRLWDPERKPLSPPTHDTLAGARHGRRARGAAPASGAACVLQLGARQARRRPPPTPHCSAVFSFCFFFFFFPVPPPRGGATRQRQCRDCGWVRDGRWAPPRNAFRVRARVAGGAARPAVRGATPSPFLCPRIPRPAPPPPPPAPPASPLLRKSHWLLPAAATATRAATSIHPRPTCARVDARVHARRPRTRLSPAPSPPQPSSFPRSFPALPTDCPPVSVRVRTW